MTRRSSVPETLETLHPAYFALVMATGIVSIAAYLLGYRGLGWGMFALNTAAYLILWILYLARAVIHPRAVMADFADHARGVGFLTMIAGTCVLGSQCIVIGNLPRLALGLWGLGIFLWVMLAYGVLTLLTVRTEKPTLVKGLNGGWLVAVVAAQSISTLGSQLIDEFGLTQRVVIFFSLAMWLAGGMLYVWLISLIFYRYTFFSMTAQDLTPPYWINMGAVAISTLAGTFLIENASVSPLLRELLPFIKGMTLLYWATATWWIPMLVTLGIWRHFYARHPLQYDPLYWGGVFPLGMYTVCTSRLADAIDADFLQTIPNVMFYIALAAWGATFFGLLKSLLIRPKDHSSQRSGFVS